MKASLRLLQSARATAVLKMGHLISGCLRILLAFEQLCCGRMDWEKVPLSQKSTNRFQQKCMRLYENVTHDAHRIL